MIKKYSVIVPSSGRDVSLIISCLESIKSQTIPAHKIYLVDDSKNQWIQAKDIIPDIVILKTGGGKRGGVARNIGIYEAVVDLDNDDYIFFLDDDDEWHQEKIQKQFESIELNNGNVDVIGSNYSCSPGKYKLSDKIKDVSQDIIYQNCGMSPSTLGIKVKSLILMEGFTPGLKAWVGRDFFIKIYLNNFKVLKQMSQLVYQNQSHEFGRVSDQRAIRYKTMFEVLRSYEKKLPPYKSKYMKMMVDRLILKEKGNTAIFLVTRYFPVAFLCGRRALIHWISVFLFELKSFISKGV